MIRWFKQRGRMRRTLSGWLAADPHKHSFCGYDTILKNSCCKPKQIGYSHNMNCKYCGSNIKWIERKPFNLDNTAHTFEYCQSLKKKAKEEGESKLVDELYPYALNRIQQNNNDLEDPNYIYVKTRLKAPVAAITKEKAKTSIGSAIASSVEFQGTLTNGAKCIVWVNQTGGFEVSPKGNSKKNKDLFYKCLFDAWHGEGNWGVK